MHYNLPVSLIIYKCDKKELAFSEVLPLIKFEKLNIRYKYEFLMYLKGDKKMIKPICSLLNLLNHFTIPPFLHLG